MSSGTSYTHVEAAEVRGLVNYRKVVVPKPEILPACKNCKHFAFDADDRQSFKGELTFWKIKLRCKVLRVSVLNNCVCDTHEFCYSDRRDK